MVDPVMAAIIQNEAKPKSERLSNVKLGEKLGLHESSIRRRKKKLGQYDDFFTDIPVSIITQRGKTTRLPDGSYEKVTYRPQDMAVHEALSFEDVASALENYRPVKTEVKGQGALIVSAADFQTGKVGSRGGTIQLVQRVVDVLDQWREELPHYETIVLADLGDVIEGFSNAVQQQQTNDLSLTDQIRVAQRVLLEVLLVLAGKCDKLIYVSVPSNHCSVRTGMGSKNRANAPDDDYGLLIQENIRMALELHPDLKHVEFRAPEKWEEAVTVVLPDGTGVGFTHGDLAGSPAKLDTWFARMSHAHRGGLHDAHILLHGHYHTPSLSMSGDCRWIVGAPSLDNGSDWFSNRSGRIAPSAMMTFEARSGKVENWKLWYPSEER